MHGNIKSRLENYHILKTFVNSCNLIVKPKNVIKAELYETNIAFSGLISDINESQRKIVATKNQRKLTYFRKKTIESMPKKLVETIEDIMFNKYTDIQNDFFDKPSLFQEIKESIFFSKKEIIIYSFYLIFIFHSLIEEFS